MDDITGARIFWEWQLPLPAPFDVLQITDTEINLCFITLVLTLLCVFLTRKLKVRPTSKKQLIAEYIVKMADNFVLGNMGARFMNFVPFIAALFALSIFSSLSGLIGFYAPTADLSVLLGWALLVFVLITYYKFKSGGPVGYLKSYLEPIPILLPFNIISEIATPISMAFRHFGNIASGGVISTLLYGALAALSHMLLGWLPGWLGTIPIFQAGIPAVLSLYFDWFSGFLQAFIFCMLTMMYIASAAGEEEPAAEEK
ncbi:MAG: FoF1 ATP synthase subunit a [Oscillospiraceae bacterium]|nr:FoF1 ATP synthase subunit a [Oscillospiraceae bacterium]